MMDELRRLLYRELYRKSLYEFVKAFWQTCEPKPLVDGVLIQFYCEAFQYMCRKWTGYEKVEINLPKLTEEVEIIDIRQEKQNININVPPRHTKSMIFNVLGPVWLWCNYPIKAASVSHTAALAGEMNSKRIKVLNSEKFKFFFGDEVWLDTSARGKLVDKRGGELYSVARESFTGHGADLIINDDLTNAETARRDREEMNSAWSYYQNTMPSRINDRNQYIIMNIQQRLAPNDITGHILANSKLANSYSFIVLPAIFERKTYLVFPISGKIHVFEPGDSLWPERFGDYSALRIEVGESVFQTQYLQKPVASDKTIIKEEMIIEKDKTEAPSIYESDMIYSSHDFPVKDKETSDFLGSVLGYKIGSTLYITDCLEKRMAFVASVNYVEQLDGLYPGIIQIIEDKANGSPILQQLQESLTGLQAFQPGTASKTQRLESASLYMHSGNIVFVRSVFNPISQKYELSESLKNLITRLLNFPFVEHDDIVDAFSMLLLFVFMDKKYMVYGRSFNDKNIIRMKDLAQYRIDYTTIFFNREGDVWKILEIGVQYGEETKLICLSEHRIKASIDDALDFIKQTYPKKRVLVDCSAAAALEGVVIKDLAIERYEVEDFDKSVTQMNIAFAKNRVLLKDSLVLTKGDIESFKFAKSKDENVKYTSNKDGFCACLRLALHYYGGIV